VTPTKQFISKPILTWVQLYRVNVTVKKENYEKNDKILNTDACRMPLNLI